MTGQKATCDFASLIFIVEFFWLKIIRVIQNTASVHSLQSDKYLVLRSIAAIKGFGY
jgi:hypothetical protein